MARFGPVYRASLKRKAVVDKYRQSEKYKEKNRRGSAKFSESGSGKAYNKEYQKGYHLRNKHTEAYAVHILKRNGGAITQENINKIRLSVTTKRIKRLIKKAL